MRGTGRPQRQRFYDIIDNLTIDRPLRVKAREWPNEKWVYDRARLNRHRVAFLNCGDERVLIRIQ